MPEPRKWTIDELRGELASLGGDAELVDLADRLASLRRDAAHPAALESIWDEITRRTSQVDDDQSASDDDEEVSGSASENASGR